MTTFRPYPGHEYYQTLQGHLQPVMIKNIELLQFFPSRTTYVNVESIRIRILNSKIHVLKT